MKKLVKLFVAIVAIVFLVRYCSDKFGNVISLPGGLGGNDSEQTGGGGGWFGQKDKSDKQASDNEDVPDDIRDLERQLGIGDDEPSSVPTSVPTSVPSSSTVPPISFKGIPIKGSASSFGAELVKAGFKKASDGTYTGDFAGYSDCKLTVVGNPVQGVRVDFPVIKDWDSLEKSYDSLQASLTQKYGIEPTTAKNSNLAVYNLPGGTINLDADVKNRSSWHVILEYSALSPALIDTTPSRNPIDDL